MSTSTSSNELTSTPPQALGKRNGRPHSADPKMKNKTASKSPKTGKGGLMNIFKNKKAKENGVVPVRPSCFNDDFVRRQESPDSPSRGPVVSSSKAHKEHRGYGLWRSKVSLCYVVCMSALSIHLLINNSSKRNSCSQMGYQLSSTVAPKLEKHSTVQ